MIKNEPLIKDSLGDDITLYSKYYSHDFYCSNCGKHNHKYIRKGNLARTQSIECDKCGCIVSG